VSKLTISEEVFKLYREYRKNFPSFRGFRAKLDRKADRLDRQNYLYTIRMLLALELLSRYPKLFVDFEGIRFITKAPASVMRALRRHLHRWVRRGAVENCKLSFDVSQGATPEIIKLPSEGLVIGRKFFIVSSSASKPRPRYIYRLESARTALLAHKKSEESDRLRGLWLLLDQTGEVRQRTDQFTELVNALGNMRKLKHFLTFSLKQTVHVHSNLLRLMAKCGLKREEVVEKLIERLLDFQSKMLEDVDEGVRAVKESGKLMQQAFKGLPDTLGLSADDLIRSEPLVREINGRHYLECAFCGYDNPVTIPVPQETTCQYCNEKYRQKERTATQGVETNVMPKIEEKRKEGVKLACTCGNTDPKCFNYDREKNETVCAKCGMVQP